MIHSRKEPGRPGPLACSLLLLLATACLMPRPGMRLEKITVARDGEGFITARTGQRFVPWGVNYGNHGRLMEDFWAEDWETFAGDFREIRAMGGNSVRLHLQFGKFMEGPNRPRVEAFAQLRRTVALAEECGLYLDLTGLACYRPSDVPPWYDALSETERWAAQAGFWRRVAATCAGSPAVFCYDLMNEPISPAASRDNWYSGNLLGEYDFVQAIALDPAGRSRGEIALAWIEAMTAAIRAEDAETMITVGMLPWVRGWKHLSGFIPEEAAPHLDFISVHIYPKTRDPEEARIALGECAGLGKPVVIEETFPLHCGLPELEAFLRESKTKADGWFWHYDGIEIEEYEASKAAGELSIPQSIWHQALQSFVRLAPEFRSEATPTRGTGR